MKVRTGDIIHNGYAGGNNPIRYSVFIEYSGKYAKCIAMSGKGKALGWVRYYASDFRGNPDGMFEVVGHIPLKEMITDQLLNLLKNNKKENDT